MTLQRIFQKKGENSKRFMYFFSIFDFYSDKEESSENNIVQKSVAKFVLDNVLECNIFRGRTLRKITMKMTIFMLPFILGLENCHINKNLH